MLSFSFLVFSCIIYLSTTSNVPDGEPANFRRDGSPMKICRRKLASCPFADLSTISPYVEGQVFLNFTTEANERICQVVGQLISCLESMERFPVCMWFADKHFGGLGKIRSFQSSLCNDQGRQDLDEVASCANNKFLQRYYYGKIMERGGEMKARMDCLDNGDITRGEMECKQQKLICSFGQDLVRSLPRKANEYCGQNVSGAVKRVLRHLYEVQTPLITLLGGSLNEADCKLVPADLFI